jgi:hypothetical protein
MPRTLASEIVLAEADTAVEELASYVQVTKVAGGPGRPGNRPQFIGWHPILFGAAPGPYV